MITIKQQYSQSSSQVSQKRKIIQQSIRREQLQCYFARKRQQLTKNFLNQSHLFQPTQSIEKVQKRNQYVKNMYLYLRNQPIVSWKQKIEQLVFLLDHFQGDFGSWIENNLTSLLAEAFQSNLAFRDIQVLTAKLFSAQICKSNPKDCISNAYISDSLVVDNVFILLKTNNYFCHQKICFVALLAQIASLSNNIRDRVVGIGMGQILTQFAEELIQNNSIEEKLILLFLGCCQSLCKVFLRRNRFYFAEPSFVSQEVITILLKIISKGMSASIVESSLSCLHVIFKNKDDALIRKLLMQKPDIFQTFLCLLRNGEIRTKEIVLTLYRLIGIFHWKYMGDYINPTDIFYCMQAQFERVHTTRSFIVTALKVIEMIVRNKRDPFCLMEHNLGKTIIEMLKNQQSDIKKAAYGVILQISGVLATNSSQLTRFIHTYNLMPLFIIEITDLVTKSSCILDVLSIIERYIQDNVFHNKDFNQALCSLQANYNLMELLQTLVYINREGLQFDKIREKAGKLIDVMVNHYSNDFV